MCVAVLEYLLIPRLCSGVMFVCVRFVSLVVVAC